MSVERTWRGLSLTREDERAWWILLERAGSKRADGLCNLFVASEDSDHRDWELMYALADMKRHMPDSKAVAHRMLEGRFGVPESILIDGFWVALG